MRFGIRRKVLSIIIVIIERIEVKFLYTIRSSRLFVVCLGFWTGFGV